MFDFLHDLNLLRPYIARRDKWRFIVLLGFMLVAAAFEVLGLGAVPAFITVMTEPSKLAELPAIGSWFDQMPSDTTPEIMVWGSVGLMVAFLVRGAFLVLVNFAQNSLVEEQRVKLSTRVFEAYQNAPYEWHLQRNSAEFIRNVSVDTRVIIEQILTPFMALALSSVVSLVVVVVLLVVTPGVASLALVIVGAGFVAVVMGFRRFFGRFGQIVKRENKVSVQAVMQGMGAVIDARIMGSESYLARVFEGSIERLARAQTLQRTMASASPLIIEMLCLAGLVLVLLILAFESGSLESNLSMLSLMAIATLRLKQTTGLASSSIHTINSARASIPHIVADLAAIDELFYRNQARTSCGLIGEFQKLELTGVGYRYPDSSALAVRDISLTLSRGESIAFVGTTGCGKSTLVNIILGLLNPEAGMVEVNGIEISQDLDGWFRNVGYIQQSIFLIDDTIRANVAFGLAAEEIDDARVWEALEIACLDSYVQSLSAGLETIVGERGVRLSGGQRQRMGIARALYRDPAVVIMDEATSALDSATEANVIRAIREASHDRTFIMIAHRLSTIEGCDRRYELGDGTIRLLPRESVA